MPAALLLVLTLFGCRETLYPTVSTPKQSPAEAWGAVLRQAVNAEGDVDYAFVQAHRRPLDGYVAWISRDNALRFRSPLGAHAFWLNAYSALAIYQVLERDVSTSICDLPSLWPGRCATPVWGTGFVVGGYNQSLWEIYNERVISGFQDFRDLGAMNPGVRSGPPVRAGVYTADAVREELNDQMAKWMRHERSGVWIDGDVAVFNETFERYSFELDLFTDGRDLCALGALYALGDKAAKLQQLSDEGCPHRFARFDRRLNGTR